MSFAKVLFVGYCLCAVYMQMLYVSGAWKIRCKVRVIHFAIQLQC